MVGESIRDEELIERGALFTEQLVQNNYITKRCDETNYIKSKLAKHNDGIYVRTIMNKVCLYIGRLLFAESLL